MGSTSALAFTSLVACGNSDPPFSEQATSPDEKERVRVTYWVPPEIASKNAALPLYIAQFDPDGSVRYHATMNLEHLRTLK